MTLFRVLIPVESHKVKKNGKQAFSKGGKSWVTRSPDAIKAENYLIQHFQLARNRQLHGETIHGDVHVKLTFIFKDYFTGKMERNKRLPDLDNLLCLPLDALVKSGIIEDDGQVCSLDGSRRRPGSENLLEVVIYAYQD